MSVTEKVTDMGRAVQWSAFASVLPFSTDCSRWSHTYHPLCKKFNKKDYETFG